MYTQRCTEYNLDMYSTTKPKHTFYAAHWPTYLLYNSKNKQMNTPTALHLKKSIIETKPVVSKTTPVVSRRSSRLTHDGGKTKNSKTKNSKTKNSKTKKNKT